jgi:hypothetical protein
MKKVVLGLIVAAAAAFAACSKSPDSPSVSFTSPLASAPATGTSYKFNAQPVTLTINNAVRTGSATATYSVEVATDTGFSNKVYTKDAITEGTGATTSVVIGSLAGNVTYYWRWKTVIDGVTGSPSPTQSFFVQQQIIINVPSISDPASGVTVSDPRPTFTTRNATTTGQVGPITYEFQVSSASSFSPIIASQVVPQQSGTTTSWTPGADLPAATLFWRVRAIDSANTETSAFTGGTSFTVQPFSLKNSIILNNPSDLASWAETTAITMIDLRGPFILADFDKRQGPGRWPESGFGDGGIQYTLGMCLNQSGQWYCSAAIQFWDGRELEAGGDVNEVGINWFYDGRWAPIAGHQPRTGEMVGIFVAQGNLRDSGKTSVKERSNVVLLPYGSTYVKK